MDALRSLSRTLDDPGLEMTSMLFEAVDRVRLALNHPDLRPAARLSMAAHVLDELSPGRCPDKDSGRLRPAAGFIADGQDAAWQIAGRLRGHPAPATAVLEQFAREPLRAGNRRETTRQPCDVDRLRLPVRRGDMIWERAADLITLSGILCAAVRLTVVRQLLPPDVAARMGGDLPFGTLCGGRLARRARAAYPAGGDPAVLSTALLVVDGQLAGYASEEVAAGFCDHAAKLGDGHGR